MMLAREGVQIELVQKQFSNSIPSRAIRSMLGVGFSPARRLPYTPKAWLVWSSAMMNNIFGCPVDVEEVHPPAKTMIPAMNRSWTKHLTRFMMVDLFYSDFKNVDLAAWPVLLLLQFIRKMDHQFAFTGIPFQGFRHPEHGYPASP
jgi:hypothetical protein